MTTNDNEIRISPTHLMLAVVFVTGLLLSNLTAGKIISVGGLVLQAADLLFPITYILGDVLTEIYGLRNARRIIWLGFACNFLSVIVFFVALKLPYPEFWHDQAAYETVFGTTPRIMIASLLGYLTGELSNSYTLVWIRRWTKGRLLFARTLGSSVIGDFLDTIVFNTIAFIGTMPYSAFFQMVAFQYCWKMGYEVLATPFTYAVVGFLRGRGEGEGVGQRVSSNQNMI